QVAFEVVRFTGHYAGGVEVLMDLAAQVRLDHLAGAQARVRRFAVDGLFEADFAPRVLRIGAENERAERATQLVVFGAKAMVAAIPGSDGLAGDVVQHPALTRFHARLLDAI